MILAGHGLERKFNMRLGSFRLRAFYRKFSRWTAWAENAIWNTWTSLCILIERMTAVRLGPPQFPRSLAYAAGDPAPPGKTLHVHWPAAGFNGRIVPWTSAKYDIAE
jgi:hypothetical protein